VRTAPERMTPDEARATMQVLEEALARIRSRVESTG
jgi:hypothetical protein